MRNSLQRSTLWRGSAGQVWVIDCGRSSYNNYIYRYTHTVYAVGWISRVKTSIYLPYSIFWSEFVCTYTTVRCVFVRVPYVLPNKSDTLQIWGFGQRCIISVEIIIITHKALQVAPSSSCTVSCIGF